MERIAILADIHANLTALKAVLSDVDAMEADAIVLLGDLVNYGPRPNHVIECIKSIEQPVIANIWGNHEYSLFGGSPDRFATERGRMALNYTRNLLTDTSWASLREMNRKGMEEINMNGHRFLLVHGTWEDPFWGKFHLAEVQKTVYQPFDYVLMAHSHVPFYLEHFYDCDAAAFRNKKRVVFINPGSVGQPRNHNPHAQYGILDLRTGGYEHRCVPYDISAEQALYNSSVDAFYKERIARGI